MYMHICIWQCEFENIIFHNSSALVPRLIMLHVLPDNFTCCIMHSNVFVDFRYPFYILKLNQSRTFTRQHRRATFDESIYQIYGSLWKHAFLWRHNFGAIILAPSLVSPHTDTRPRMAPKLWRESYSAKGMHALIDYHRSDILPSNVERLCPTPWLQNRRNIPKSLKSS